MADALSSPAPRTGALTPSEIAPHLPGSWPPRRQRARRSRPRARPLAHRLRPPGAATQGREGAGAPPAEATPGRRRVAAQKNPKEDVMPNKPNVLTFSWVRRILERAGLTRDASRELAGVVIPRC